MNLSQKNTFYLIFRRPFSVKKKKNEPTGTLNFLIRAVYIYIYFKKEYIIMVKKGILMDDFDSIRIERIASGAISAGNTSSGNIDVEVELYDKNLVLTEKWDKLPVLEKINLTPDFDRNCGPTMELGLINMLKHRIEIYNCEADDVDDDHLIDAYTIVITQDAGVITAFVADHTERDFNIPLRNTITIRHLLESDLAVNVAGPQPVGESTGLLFLNIDWMKYTADQLKEWILKEVFIDQ